MPPRTPPLRWLLLCLLYTSFLHGQQAGAGPRVGVLSLAECIDYTLAHQPALRAAREELQLTALDNRIAVSAWLPSVTLSGNAQHYFQLPVSIFPDFENPGSGETREVAIGTVNNSTATASLRQTLYNPTVALAVRRQSPLVHAAQLAVEEREIEVSEQVSTTFYRAVRAREQLRILTVDLAR